MSIMVSPVIIDGDRIIELWKEPKEAGFAPLRDEFFGRRELSELGCKAITILVKGDVYVFRGEGLDELQQDIELIKANLKELIQTFNLEQSKWVNIVTRNGPEKLDPNIYLSEILDNILEAITIAKHNPEGNVGVCIS